jgi:hypothetical protein
VKRVLFGFFAAMALFFVVRFGVHALASDETKIRWRIESMVDGFNRERAAPVMRGFHPDYRDASSDADRELVHSGIVSVFFRERDPETKRFRLRVEIPRDTLSIEVAEDGSSAMASGVLTIFEQEQEGELVMWSTSFEGELQRGEDGFRFVSSRHETDEGERPR